MTLVLGCSPGMCSLPIVYPHLTPAGLQVATGTPGCLCAQVRSLDRCRDMCGHGSQSMALSCWGSLTFVYCWGGEGWPSLVFPSCFSLPGSQTL